MLRGGYSVCLRDKVQAAAPGFPPRKICGRERESERDPGAVRGSCQASGRPRSRQEELWLQDNPSLL